MDQPRTREDGRVIRVVSDASSPAAIDLMREYMTIIQIELFGTAELPAALATECEDAARVYAAPGAWFVAYDGDAPAGCVGVRPVAGRPGVAEIKRLYVRPAHRGSGLARELMAVAHRQAESAFTMIALDVRPQRPQVVEFYRRLGYRVVAPPAENPYQMIFMEFDL